MARINRSQLTVFSGPIIEKDGTERMYVGAYIPESASPAAKLRVQDCLGFLAVPTIDQTTYPQPRDGWVARPAREDEATIKDVFTTVIGPDSYESITEPILRPVLAELIGHAALTPPTNR